MKTKREVLKIYEGLKIAFYKTRQLSNVNHLKLQDLATIQSKARLLMIILNLDRCDEMEHFKI